MHPTRPRGDHRDPDEEWQRVLDHIARRRSELSHALQDARPSSSEMLDAVLMELHQSRPSLLAHVRRVARYAAATALEMGLPALARLHVERAALVHDLGKLALPESLRTAPARFSVRELLVVRSHSMIGAQLTHAVPFLRVTAPMVAATHERFGGGGHPLGIGGDAIPLGARIIAVTDAWDAFAGDPDERDSGAAACADMELIRHAGSHFDPAIVRAWLRAAETSQTCRSHN